MAQQLSKSHPDGTCLGQSASDKVGFYGDTAVAQPAITAIGTTTATTTLLETRISRLEAALVSLNLVSIS